MNELIQALARIDSVYTAVNGNVLTVEIYALASTYVIPALYDTLITIAYYTQSNRLIPFYSLITQDSNKAMFTVQFN